MHPRIWLNRKISRTGADRLTSLGRCLSRRHSARIRMINSIDRVLSKMAPVPDQNNFSIARKAG
jgi:hypothetical protein